MPDWAYALACDGKPGVVKMGGTARSARERVAELASEPGYGAFAPFRVLAEQEVPDWRRVEASVHWVLRRRPGCQVQLNVGAKELYRLTETEAITVLGKAVARVAAWAAKDAAKAAAEPTARPPSPPQTAPRPTRQIPTWKPPSPVTPRPLLPAAAPYTAPPQPMPYALSPQATPYPRLDAEAERAATERLDRFRPWAAWLSVPLAAGLPVGAALSLAGWGPLALLVAVLEAPWLPWRPVLGVVAAACGVGVGAWFTAGARSGRALGAGLAGAFAAGALAVAAARSLLVYLAGPGALLADGSSIGGSVVRVERLWPNRPDRLHVLLGVGRVGRSDVLELEGGQPERYLRGG